VIITHTETTQQQNAWELAQVVLLQTLILVIAFKFVLMDGMAILTNVLPVAKHQEHLLQILPKCVDLHAQILLIAKTIHVSKLVRFYFRMIRLDLAKHFVQILLSNYLLIQ
jgi:hypothetical protein